MSKPILYTFGHSVWAAAPELALIELGYTQDDVEKKVVNLAEGENFAPAFLDINPQGTVPTLEAGGEAYTSTAKVTSYLVAHASNRATVAPGTEFMSKIHQEQYDPNFPLLSARHEDELRSKASGHSMTFVQNRQNALSKHSGTPQSVDHRNFYDAKVAENGKVLSIYQAKAPENVKNGFFEISRVHWDTLKAFILDELPDILPESGFLGGDIPGEDDFHLAAWLARIVFAAGGGDSSRDGVHSIEKELGKPTPERVVSYWTAWSRRKSWQDVYANGLH
ncbi:hypothetical protein DEU56DRAFT_489271 [Suillus clintonianus]|uniref:uncharacterized protein n=1 Tax=Suillus clintonianus TaxID=1904413 RepID=UPI001B882C8C|nr:uncharacterized protein DEU56DRAFT_489271 [Suillus clintonianus]KAG2129951.1 hypothetical protein DEU56DRAFT_489271 [Suillus clintonianus]